MLLIDPNVVPIVGIVAFLGAFSISARYVMKPVIEAFMRAREMKLNAGAHDPGRMEAQERRIAELEADLGALRQDFERLSAVEEFYSRLGEQALVGGRSLPGGEAAGSGSGRPLGEDSDG